MLTMLFSAVRPAGGPVLNRFPSRISPRTMQFANSSVARSTRMLLVALPAWLVGCSEPETEKPSKPAISLSPEERFEAFLSTLRRQIEDDSMGSFQASNEFNAPVGTPVTNAKIEVESELIKPEGEAESYRARVCLINNSKVTVVLPGPSEEEVAEAKAEQEKEIEQLEQELEGVGELDSLLTPPKLASSGGTTIHEIKSEEDTNCYELEFREGRWELISELDRENKPFYASVIEYSLKRQ